jgi:hypothetical protein
LVSDCIHHETCVTDVELHAPIPREDLVVEAFAASEQERLRRVMDDREFIEAMLLRESGELPRFAFAAIGGLVGDLNLELSGTRVRGRAGITAAGDLNVV